jgi:hypothetical protein
MGSLVADNLVWLAFCTKHANAEQKNDNNNYSIIFN